MPILEAYYLKSSIDSRTELPEASRSSYGRTCTTRAGPRPSTRGFFAERPRRLDHDGDGDTSAQILH
jgi:hypothetical protein